MPTYYVDPAAGGADNGSSWADAWTSMNTALDGVNTTDGDVIFVTGVENDTTSSRTWYGGTGISPIIVIGCTSADVSNIVPGWATGLEKIPANLAFNNANIPVYHLSTSAYDLSILGSVYFYAYDFQADDNVAMNTQTVHTRAQFEECRIGYDINNVGGTAAKQGYYEYLNCHLDCGISSGTEAIAIGDGCELLITGGKLTQQSNFAGYALLRQTHRPVVTGLDMSANQNQIVETSVSGMDECNPVLRQCKFHASTDLWTGTRSDMIFRIECYQCGSLTGLGAGDTNQEFDISTDMGDITLEEVIVRTGGGDDQGTGQWAYAFTPASGRTIPIYHPLKGPEMRVYVAGDGTTKTVDCFFTHSAAGGALQDDEIWLRLYSVSPDGDALAHIGSSRVDLGGTPANYATAGTWAGSETYAQKMSVDIDPAHSGWVVGIVFVATGLAETIRVCPKMEVSAA